MGGWKTYWEKGEQVAPQGAGTVVINHEQYPPRVVLPSGAGGGRGTGSSTTSNPLAMLADVQWRGPPPPPSCTRLTLKDITEDVGGTVLLTTSEPDPVEGLTVEDNEGSTGVGPGTYYRFANPSVVIDTVFCKSVAQLISEHGAFVGPECVPVIAMRVQDSRGRPGQTRPSLQWKVNSKPKWATDPTLELPVDDETTAEPYALHVYLEVPGHTDHGAVCLDFTPDAVSSALKFSSLPMAGTHSSTMQPDAVDRSESLPMDFTRRIPNVHTKLLI
jgi:hypothetical protein